MELCNVMELYIFPVHICITARICCCAMLHSTGNFNAVTSEVTC